MSAGEINGQQRLDAVENARRLLDEFVDSLARVLESMADHKPNARWEAVFGPPEALAKPGPEAELLWWEQPFSIAAGATAWVASPRATWEYAGTLPLKAAGLETVEKNEVRNTWIEILGQSLAAMARSISSFAGRDVTCEAGAERASGPDAQEWASISLDFESASLAPLLITLSPKLLAMISEAGAEPDPAPAQDSPWPGAGDERAPQNNALATNSAAGGTNRSVAQSRTMDLLLDVDLPVSISFGKAQLAMKEVLKLTTGSIIELNRAVDEPVEVLVNNSLIARGEVVVVDGNYGVRIREIASRQDRLRSIR